MALDLSALSAYTEQQKNDLIRKSLLGAKTISLVNKQYGIKSSETLNIMDGGSLTAQPDGCSFTPTGSTTLSQKTITVAPIKFQEEICPKNLNAYYTQKFLDAGSKDQEFNFEQQWTDMKAEQIAEYFEKNVWTANISASGSLFDGFEKQVQSMASPSGSFRVNSGSAFNASSSIGILNAVWSAIPAQVLDKDDLVVFMGSDTKRTYRQGVIALNNFYDAGAGDFILGTKIPIVEVNGLNGTGNHIYAGRKSGFYFGSDLSDDFENFEVWYSRDFKTVRFDSAMKAGTQIAFPSEIVFYIG